MSLIPIDFNPTPNFLRRFSALFIAFFALLALLQSRAGHATAAVALLAIGAGVGATGLAWPKFARVVYVSWMCFLWPFGWLFSLLVLTLVFYAVVTPIAIGLRLAGRETLGRRFDPTASTYWVRRGAKRPPSDYFRRY